MNFLTKLSIGPKRSYQPLSCLFKQSNLLQASQRHFSNFSNNTSGDNEIEIPNSLETQAESPLFKLLDQDPTNQRYKSIILRRFNLLTKNFRHFEGDDISSERMEIRDE